MTAHQVRSYGPSVTTENRPPFTASGRSTANRERAPLYEIRVAGLLAPRWSAWFDGLTVTAETDGSTVIRGPVVDQAALHGLLQKLRDVGIPLISLTRLPVDTPGDLPVERQLRGVSGAGAAGRAPRRG